MPPPPPPFLTWQAHPLPPPCPPDLADAPPPVCIHIARAHRAASRQPGSPPAGERIQASACVGGGGAVLQPGGVCWRATIAARRGRSTGRAGRPGPPGPCIVCWLGAGSGSGRRRGGGTRSPRCAQGGKGGGEGGLRRGREGGRGGGGGGGGRKGGREGGEGWGAQAGS